MSNDEAHYHLIREHGMTGGEIHQAVQSPAVLHDTIHALLKPDHDHTR